MADPALGSSRVVTLEKFGDPACPIVAVLDRARRMVDRAVEIAVPVPDLDPRVVQLRLGGR